MLRAGNAISQKLFQTGGMLSLSSNLIGLARNSSQRSTELKTCSLCKSVFSDRDVKDRITSRTLFGIVQELGQENSVEKSSCEAARKPTFSHDVDNQQSCELASLLKKIIIPIINIYKEQFSDVVIDLNSIGPVWMGAVSHPPERDVGNMNGDYGRSLAKFIEDCRESLPEKIGGFIDIGGQNNLTVKGLNEVLNDNLKCTVVDLNPLIPALSKKEANISYLIGDAKVFLLPEKNYFDSMGENKIFILNNFLNVLSPKIGWEMLDAVWEKMEKGDFMVVGGLPIEQLEKSFTKGVTENGITAFHRKDKKGTFHKSGLSEEFICHIKNLIGAQVVKTTQKKFKIEIENNLRGKWYKNKHNVKFNYMLVRKN